MTRAEAREKAKTDPIFLGEILGYDVQEDVHNDLFLALRSGKDKRLILWPRGHFKTSCVVIEIVRRILNDPDIRVLVMQATLKLTKLWVKEIKSHFDGTNANSKLPILFPDFCKQNNPEWKADAFSFTVPARTRKHLAQATVTAASPRAVQTGQHYTLMCFDDLVNTANFRNVELLDKLESEFYHFLPLLDPGGDVIVTGTRYSFADIYARIIAKDRGVDEWEISIRGVYKADGSLLFPKRPVKDGSRYIGFTLELLASLKRDDPEMFAPQYLNTAVASKDQLFPPTLLQGITKSTQDPEYPKGAPCIFTIDLAEGKTAASDSSVIAVGRVDVQGRVWIDDVVGGQLSPHALVLLIINLFMRHRPVRILIEKQAGAEFFVEFLRTIAREKGLNLPLDFLKSSRQKDAKYLRIAALEGAFKQKRLFLLAGITDYPKVSEEFEQFPRGRHDDRPDCIAMLFSALAQQIPFRPTLKQLPYFFDVPHSTETPSGPAPLLGTGFSC